MTILELIKAQCKVFGINDKYAKQIEKISGITKEEDGNIIAAVKNFKENILPIIQSVESSVEEARQKAIEDYEQKFGIKNGKLIKPNDPDPDPDPNPNPNNELGGSIKAIIESQNKQIQQLTQTIEGFSKSINNSEKKAAAAELFKESKLPAKWLSRIDITSEESIDKQIEKLKEEWSEIRQSIINDQIEHVGYNPNKYQPKDRTDEEWRKFMDNEGDGGQIGDNSVASLNLDND